MSGVQGTAAFSPIHCSRGNSVLLCFKSCVKHKQFLSKYELIEPTNLSTAHIIFKTECVQWHNKWSIYKIKFRHVDSVVNLMFLNISTDLWSNPVDNIWYFNNSGVPEPCGIKQIKTNTCYITNIAKYNTTYMCYMAEKCNIVYCYSSHNKCLKKCLKSIHDFHFCFLHLHGHVNCCLNISFLTQTLWSWIKIKSIPCSALTF